VAVTQPATPVIKRSESRSGRVAIALIVALVLVFGAWLIGGQQDFSSIGKGGTNAKLLPRVGEQAPDFAAYRLDASLNLVEVNLSDYAGQPIWLNFWASWCQPCRAELPEIMAAYELVAPEGIVMLAVSLREPIEDAYLFAMQNNMPWAVLSDPDGTMVGQTYAINNFPTHIFIDADGIVRDVELAPLSTDAAIAAAEKAINPTPGAD
jgi:cytochrome c biogenesis protein CcmG/thiol:disulfide interchange protein DsbE